MWQIGRFIKQLALEMLILLYYFFVLLGIELGPKNKEEKVGGDVLFECYAPTAISVAWKKNGRIIDFDHETRFTVSTVKHAILVIISNAISI